MSQTYQCRIYVTLRPSVLDPAGTAVESGLKQLGYQGVQQVRIGKYIELTVTAKDETDAKDQLDQMCEQLLANTVIENYRFELTPIQSEVMS
ncbi:phosphoribosylformylglycinamidine synthase, purS [Gloeothece citriformis PCC 7424]|uniref:Phosphoribosylformylglycinamidine synthase subunit PurS n=1 Tax=Gloeothece citriformis (strain PCC 7424) TaxID=65393 RepID=B7KHH6_GLOC7|nr:phosphoribosylformylglycinamidine synthase subunit PurS [Gloeothece citriformis]ACK70671.1 phosphoribosylformylglycinamidine synthase, purS [Gloeothece citriformis PCC 7424]